MAQISLTIPDNVISRVVDAIAVKFNYAINQTGGETKNQFAKRMLGITLKQWVKDAEVGAVYVTAKATQATTEQDIESNIVIS